MTRRLVLVLFAVLGAVVLAHAEPRGHAHNDYRHERPLLDALDHEFASVEADIFLVDGQLLVAHDLKDVSPERSLEALYLDPLQRRVRENDGKVHPGLDEFILLVDIKSDGETTYQALKPVLEKYRDMLTSVSGGVEQKGPVTVILSGDYPLETVAAESTRLVAVDGRPHHLGQGYPVHLMPLISSSWHGQFKWYGVGPIPEDIRAALHDLVRRTHEEGRLVRFWATPDRTEVWDEEVAAGVDLINADNLAKLRYYLSQKARPPFARE